MIPDAALGAIIAATVTGIVSLLGLIISKESKTSDFRQAWIDALRLEISTVITHAHSLHGSRSAGTPSTLDLWKLCQSDFVEINRAIASIELRLNPDEENNKLLLLALRELERVMGQVSDKVDHNDLYKCEREILSRGHILLKKEWGRVKAGENAYKFSRLAALIIMIIGTFLIFMNLL